MDAFVIMSIVAGWGIGRILIDSGSSTNIIFTGTFNQMKLSRSKLQPSESPLIEFGGNRSTL
jgi:hypothetical protein